MDRKNIITLAAAGAIILAGAGTAAGVTAHNYNVAKQAAEQEGLTAITVDYTQPAPSVDTGTTAPDTTAPVTTQAPTKGESSSKSTTAPKTTTEAQTTKITWTYDAELSKQVGVLLESHPKFKNSPFDPKIKKEFHPENFISWYDNTIGKNNSGMGFVGPVSKDSPVAQAIIDAWTEVAPPKAGEKFGIVIYKYSTGWYYAVICY